MLLPHELKWVLLICMVNVAIDTDAAAVTTAPTIQTTQGSKPPAKSTAPTAASTMQTTQATKGTPITTETTVPTTASSMQIKQGTTRNPKNPLVSCDFDNGLCGWHNDKTDMFDWTLKKGGTATFGTGPSRDHTTGQGQYVYIETSAPWIYGDNARLISEDIPASNTYCLQFWYHMYGLSVGSLQVYSKQLGAKAVRLWELSGTQGNQWKQAQIKIPTQTSTFNIYFEGIKGMSYTGDIGLDDIKLDKTSPCTDVSPTTTVLNTEPVTCDFDNGLCGWSNDKADKFSWTLQTGSTGSSGTGPTRDHTTGLGKYIYIESSIPRIEGDNARLISGNVSASNTSCLHFWYHMYGYGIGKLRVYSKLSGGNAILLWELKGNQGNQWLQGQLRIPPQARDFNIIFEGVEGTSYTGDIGLDDIKLDKVSSCAGKPASAITTPIDVVEAIQFQCLPQGWALTVDYRKLSLQLSNVSNIYIQTETCTGSVLGGVLNFKTTYDMCNTHAEIANGEITFSNKLEYAKPELIHVVNDISWEYEMQCTHPLNASASVQIASNGKAANQGSSSGQTSGSLIDIAAFKDDNFKVHLNVALTGSPVYVQVVSHTPPDVIMVLDHCEARIKSTNATKSITLIENRCSVDKTTSILTIRSELARFKFAMFHYPSSMEDISVTCDVHYCDQSDLSSTCEQRCIINPSVIG